MKNKKLWISILVVLLVLVLGAQIADMQEQQLISRTKAHLKNIGDSVLVSDIYPGEWVEVCATPSNDGKWGLSFWSAEAIAAKDDWADASVRRKYTKYVDRLWIPSFEVYLARIETPDRSACISQELAKFEMIGSFSNRKAIHPKADVPNNFIEVIFTSNPS